MSFLNSISLSLIAIFSVCARRRLFIIKVLCGDNGHTFQLRKEGCARYQVTII